MSWIWEGVGKPVGGVGWRDGRILPDDWKQTKAYSCPGLSAQLQLPLWWETTSSMSVIFFYCQIVMISPPHTLLLLTAGQHLFNATATTKDIRGLSRTTFSERKPQPFTIHLFICICMHIFVCLFLGIKTQQSKRVRQMLYHWAFNLVFRSKRNRKTNTKNIPWRKCRI